VFKHAGRTVGQGAVVAGPVAETVADATTEEAGTDEPGAPPADFVAPGADEEPGMTIVEEEPATTIVDEPATTVEEEPGTMIVDEEPATTTVDDETGAGDEPGTPTDEVAWAVSETGQTVVEIA